ncbi:hypothetical protein CK203_004179 [Vitis vinifera]|uniref:Zinc-finger domain-containing protein n=1 Tax=Vitis vinifera TaxID=29760 RepID=A0A438K9N8_VITVI|nr:hypothetical protein CK203_004179 [Vitis vinifera]
MPILTRKLQLHGYTRSHGRGQAGWQKKLCGEEGCKRCGNLDIDEPCIGKTDCSVCHSSNGVLCRACLKVRYGEEMDEVRANKNWMCPHCIEEKGINPKWICNSSFCLKKRRMAPTGIAIFRAREMGYKSVHISSWMSSNRHRTEEDEGIHAENVDVLWKSM